MKKVYLLQVIMSWELERVIWGYNQGQQCQYQYCSEYLLIHESKDTKFQYSIGFGIFDDDTISTQPRTNCVYCQFVCAT